MDRFWAFLAALVWGGAFCSTHAAVLEDQFGTATLISGVTNIVGDNTLATAQLGEPGHCHCGDATATHSVWARWTPLVTGTYTIATSNSTFDTVLSVYTGTTLNNLTLVGSSDDIDFRDLTSLVTFRAYAGEVFHIAVDGVNGAQGEVRLRTIRGGVPMVSWSTYDPYGGTVLSQNISNAVLLVDFWETTCGACVDELPDLVRLQRTLAPKGFSIVGLSIDLDPGDVRNFLSVHDEISYPMLMSSKTATSSLLGGPVGVPTKYLVDQERNIVARYLGGHDPVSETYPFYSGEILRLLRLPSIVELRIERQAGAMTVSWPESDPAFRLESSTDPTTAIWRIAQGTVQTNSGRVVFTLPLDDSNLFFRASR